MRVASSGYGVAGERRFSDESVERLAKHELFDFQIQHSAISVRVAELHDLVMNGRGEPDLPDLLDEFVHELEDDLMAAGGTEMFLLAALQHFRQSMEMYLEMDMDARMAQSGAVKNIFAIDKSSKKSGGKATASPMRPRAVDRPQTPTRSPGRKNGAPRQHTKKTGASDDDIVCGVCFQADSLEHDPIVICDLCNVAVHQSCYRIEDLPEDDWFCRPCQAYLRSKDVSSNVLPTYELQCVACLAKGGAFIGTVDNEWVHMACSMFLPELYIDSTHRHDGEEIINGIDQLKERRSLRCCYCKKKERGACAQCAVGKCATSYHVLCALKHNLKFVFMDGTGQFGSGCARHQPKFLGLDQQQQSTAPAEKPRPQVAQRPSSAPLSRQTREAKAKMKLPRRRNSMTSESSDGADGDGILLDEESDNSSMFSSDIDSDINSPQRVKSPARRIDLTKPESSPRTHRGSPGKSKSPGRVRPTKKQQTLMVPAFGIVKQLQKPAAGAPPIARAQAPPSLPAPAKPAAPVAATGSAPQTISRPPTTKLHMPTTLRTTKTQLFVPFTGMVVENGVFEEMLVEIPILPLGISIRTEVRPHGNSMVIQGPLSHTNLMVSDAIRQGVLQEGDEIVSVNDVPMRGRDVGVLKELLTGMQPPYRVWLRLKTKRSLAKFCKINRGADTGAMSAPSTPVPAMTTPSKPPVVPVSDSKPKQVQLTFETPSKPSTDEQKQSSDKTTERTPMEEATAADWPWFYLRSDGKLAMNLMWKSLDAGFFVSKFDPATWESLLGKVEAHLGFRLDKTHPEYLSTTADLLVVPSREFAVPQYIQEFRRSRSQKKRNLANDSVFMGVNLEQVSQEEWDNLPALAVGTTVHVAKRTWPGINKLGGAGRVKKVHEETSPDGQKKRSVYDIAYILGGSEKKVERKWIAVVKDFNTPPDNASEEEEPTKPMSDEKTKAEEKEPDTQRLRYGMRLETLDQDASLPAVTRSTERKVHLQISVLTNSVSLERDVVKGSDEGGASKREMLWHQHFPVKQSGLDVLISDSVGATVEYMEELGEDEDPDAEEEESEVTKQLLQAQEQLKLVMERNDALFSALKLAVDSEYATKAYRRRKLEEIQWKHYEAMYREVDAAREAFEDSDDDGDDPMTGDSTQRPRSKSGERKRESEQRDDSDSDQDDSCGGMFINKIKQEGDEVCVLCQLTGGDFAATSCGRVVHPQCAMYTPETFFKDGVAHGIDKIPADERRALTCAVCGRKNGLSKIQCANQRCMVAFHVACAYVNGLLTRDPHYQAWCPKHLKTSGMQGEIEWPPHMRKNRDQANDTPAKSPRRESSGGGTISSAKSNSKRKRGRSKTADSSAEPPHKGKKAPPTGVIHIDDDDDEPNCARRLVIDDDSDDDVVLVDDPQVVFKKGDTVRVEAREGPGINKPGGVGRVTQVNEATNATGDKVVTYDVAYILDNAKEKQVDARYVKPYTVGSHTSEDAPKKKRSRTAAAPV